MGSIQWANPNVPPSDDQRLVRRDPGSCMDRHVELSLAEAVNLEPDEPPRVRPVRRLVDEILHQVAVDPGLDARPPRHDAQPVPALVDEVAMAFVDLLLRRE